MKLEGLPILCEEYDADSHPICGPLLDGIQSFACFFFLRRCLSPVLRGADETEAACSTAARPGSNVWSD